jgi:Holliday junction resolvase-like predicted endonuclease
MLNMGDFSYFVKYKTFKGSFSKHPALSVTTKYIAKLLQLGEFYLSLKHLKHMQSLLDVIAVQMVDG